MKDFKAYKEIKTKYLDITIAFALIGFFTVLRFIVNSIVWFFENVQIVIK